MKIPNALFLKREHIYCRYPREPCLDLYSQSKINILIPVDQQYWWSKLRIFLHNINIKNNSYQGKSVTEVFCYIGFCLMNISLHSMHSFSSRILHKTNLNYNLHICFTPPKKLTHNSDIHDYHIAQDIITFPGNTVVRQCCFLVMATLCNDSCKLESYSCKQL